MENKELVNKLIEYNQEHLIDLINDKKNVNLVNQLKKTDFEELKELFYITQKKVEVEKIKLELIDCVDKYNLELSIKSELDNIGKNIISNNEYAVVTMAGGQGTRLEHIGPKGTYLININGKKKSLFEVLVDSLKKNNKKFNVVLNWFIMTSSENDEATQKFFEDNLYFGYPKENIYFFQQENKPLLDENGKLILDEMYNIKEAADGNGCVFAALRNNGMLNIMRKKGINWIFIGSVDNILLDLADITLLGLTIQQKNEIATKSIIKANPYEKVGVICRKNGIPTVIEYSELSLELAEAVNENGELLYGESHIMCNLFSINSLEKISSQKLPYHFAHKKIKYMNPNGNVIIPTEPNVYKFETFIFDSFTFFDDITILRGKREDDFAPIKNKEGIDSPETAVLAYLNKINNDI